MLTGKGGNVGVLVEVVEVLHRRVLDRLRGRDGDVHNPEDEHQAGLDPLQRQPPGAWVGREVHAQAVEGVLA